jgi:nitrogen fixation protein FixH
MKGFNWGWKIFIVYGGFVAFMLFLVYKTSKVNIDLVTKDYYAQELEFQTHLDASKRSNELTEKLSWQVGKEQIFFQLPSGFETMKVSGNILFYCPSEANNDYSLAFTPDASGLFVASVKELKHGAYKIKINWSADGEAYYDEGIININ